MEPTEQDLADPMFEAVWQAIKAWDLERERGRGYAGASGTDVMTILEAVRPFVATARQDEREACAKVVLTGCRVDGPRGIIEGQIAAAIRARKEGGD